MEDSADLSKCLMSPSCCVVPKNEQYSRLPPSCGGATNGSRRLWRKLLRRFLRQSNKCICGSTAVHNNNSRSSPLTFQYDALSHSQNVDEGSHHQDYRHFRQLSPLYGTHFR